MRKTLRAGRRSPRCSVARRPRSSARPRRGDDAVTMLKPARVFDGEAMHEGWAVRVKGERIDAVGPDGHVAAAGAKVIDLPGTTLTPGLVEGHSHILLHAYSETSWTDQVSREGLALRVARAANHLRDTLKAGFTTVRDLGTEGAGYADVELKQAVRQGIIPGPRVLASTRAIVATGSYQPQVRPRMERAAGRRGSRRRRQPHARRARSDRQRRRLDQAVRRLPLGTAAGLAPDVLARRNEAAPSKPRRAPACRSPCTRTPPEGMRRAALAGVETIEHGGEGTPEVFKLMAEHHVALCPTHYGGRRAVAARRIPTRPPRSASAPASRPRSTPA